jgi:hypothetical protein
VREGLLAGVVRGGGPREAAGGTEGALLGVARSRASRELESIVDELPERIEGLVTRRREVQVRDVGEAPAPLELQAAGLGRRVPLREGDVPAKVMGRLGRSGEIESHSERGTYLRSDGKTGEVRGDSLG